MSKAFTIMFNCGKQFDKASKLIPKEYSNVLDRIKAIDKINAMILFILTVGMELQEEKKINKKRKGTKCHSLANL